MTHLEIVLHRSDFALDIELHLTQPTLALFGPSGCGKSTTLFAIAGLLKPESGHIELAGNVLFDSRRGIDQAAPERDVGFVFQEARLFPHLTVGENLRYGMPRGAPPAAFDEVVSLLRLAQLIRRHPPQLSGGQARRVAIGRALLRHPQVLLLDEPLAGLHREARDDVLFYLRELKPTFGLTTILVSHRPEDILAIADCVAWMDDGRVTAVEDVAAFRASLQRSPPARPQVVRAMPQARAAVS